jgi:hypothetical protein
MPRSYHPAAQLMPQPQLSEALGSLRNNIARAVAAMPTHETWLARSAADCPETPIPIHIR